MAEELFFIRDARFVVGNCASWWRPLGTGYTCNIDEAWQVTRADAETYGLRSTDQLLPVAAVLPLSVRHFDVQLLKKINTPKRKKTGKVA